MHSLQVKQSNIFFSGVPDIEVSDIMQFITGSPTVPVMGFKDTLKLEFVHVYGCVPSCRCFPRDSSCGLIFRIPLHLAIIGDFKTSFHGTLKNGFAFAVICMWHYHSCYKCLVHPKLLAVNNRLFIFSVIKFVDFLMPSFVTLLELGKELQPLIDLKCWKICN